MDKDDEYTVTPSQRQSAPFFLSGFLAQSCVVAICVMIGLWMGVYSSHPGLDWTDTFHRLHLHPFLMVVAVVFSATEAILIFRMLRTISKPTVKAIHVFLHTATLALVGTALAAVIKSKNDLKFAHFYSAHSWFALIVLFLYASEYVAGIIVFVLPTRCISDTMRQNILPFHKFFGLCTYIFALITIGMGVFDFLESIVGTSAYSNLGLQARLGNAICVILLILGATVVHILTRSTYARPSTSDSLFEPEPL